MYAVYLATGKYCIHSWFGKIKVWKTFNALPSAMCCNSCDGTFNHACVMFPQVAGIWSLSVGEVCPCWHAGLGKLRQKHLANRNKCPATMILRSQYKKCTLHSDFRNMYSTSLNLCGAPLFDKCNPQVHALARKSSWYTFKSGLSTSNLSEMIHWRPGFLHGRLHWSLTSLTSRQPKLIDLALGVRKQSWIGGLMRRIETFQNILTSFCCIRIIIRQFCIFLLH